MSSHHYSRTTYRVEVVPDVTTEGEAVFVARHPELPGCLAHGRTPEEAEGLLSDARSLYLESLIEEGVEPPRPAEGPVTRVFWTHADAGAVAQEGAGKPVRVFSPADSATRAYAQVA